MKLRTIVFCAALGICAANIKADIGISLCPGGPYPACMEWYGKVGSRVWICCKDSSHTACINYWKQKWLCDNDPGDPATYGYTIESSSNTVSLNCDPSPTNTCY